MMGETKRIFLIVLDSFGMGEMPDAARYGDAGSDTLRSVASSPCFDAPFLTSMGLFNIDGVDGALSRRAVAQPAAAFARLGELSAGKDTTIGHWELAGVVSEKPLPTYPDGFPEELICRYERETGRGVICNKPYSGTQVLLDYGREQKETGALIVYTSADSVFQVAAHEKYIGLNELYRCCEIARDMLTGENGVGRVIARPYVGEYPDYTRTANRHDYSLAPPGRTMLDELGGAGYDVIGVGKIADIFAGRGVTQSYKTKSNADGIKKTLELMEEDFRGLCFVNLVDFDTVYGHRNDTDGYAKAISAFDSGCRQMAGQLKETDILMITADHGCDPGTASTDHSREYVPLLLYGASVEPGKNYGTAGSFGFVAEYVTKALMG